MVWASEWMVWAAEWMVWAAEWMEGQPEPEATLTTKAQKPAAATRKLLERNPSNSNSNLLLEASEDPHWTPREELATFPAGGGEGA
eukprot:511809-Prorocentrum_minimum.AAC.1